MATTAFTIYSHYDPAQREQLERETGQVPLEGEEVDSGEAWEAEARLAFHKRQLPPPRFVPAQRDSIVEPPKSNPHPTPASDVAGWYRSLTETTNPRPRVASQPAAAAGPSTTTMRRPPERRDKNNWFIMNAIASEPPPVAAAPSTLADILERDPPQQGYTPPVWLALGPANRGFAMLQNSGWSEGEPLGPGIVRRCIASDREPQEMIPTTAGNQVHMLVKEEEIIEEPIDEVIDLTMSDSESSEESDPENGPIHDNTTSISEDTEGSLRKALITPIATVLKSDRLGIGLKAKTVGPYKASQKRITHNAAAMSAHTKAAEELRKQKKKMGRGHRGFARQKKVEETNRKELLAYMNAG
ncbi:hypothetical protein C8F04DRAFT_1160112 [Mycena alexandri]|uniref:G-patch domain-containing protein n=1 Tax=Mycena alexandri TaxID=1745969 RepID=A0AAD6RXF1_9AGAR|nr:hypothetical protein C8F04DRAFT_1160112 [Mycena alexandri]